MKKLLIVYLLIIFSAFLGCTTPTNQGLNLNKLSDAEIAAYNNDPNNTDKIVCKNEADIGSRIPNRVCRMQSSIDNRSRQDQRALENVQSRPDFGGTME